MCTRSHGSAPAARTTRSPSVAVATASSYCPPTSWLYESATNGNDTSRESEGAPSLIAASAQTRECEVSPNHGTGRGRAEHRCASARRRRVEVPDRLLRPGTDRHARVRVGLAGEGGDDTQRELDILRGFPIECPRDRTAKVVELEQHICRQPSSSGPTRFAPIVSSVRRVVLGVPSAPRVDVAAVVESFARVLAQRLEHAGSASSPSSSRRSSSIDFATRPASASSDVPGLDARRPRRPPPRPRRRSSRRTRRGGRRRAARSRSSSEYDQSTVARSVWCRSTAVRRPPVSSRNRSSRSAAMSAGVMAATRAAASSIASGMPSSRRQISDDRAAFDVVEREARSGRRGAVDEERHRRRSARPSFGVAGRGRASPASASGHDLLAVDAEALPAGREDPHVGADAGARSRRDRPTASSRCSQLSSTSSSDLARRNSSMLLFERRARDAAARRGSPRRPARSASSSFAARELAEPRAIGKRGSTSAATCIASRVLPTPPDAGERDQRATSSSALRDGDRAPASRPTNDVSWRGEVAGERVERPQRRELRGETGRARAGRRAPGARGRGRRCSPRSSSSTSAGRSSRTSSSVGERRARSGRRAPPT